MTASRQVSTRPVVVPLATIPTVAQLNLLSASENALLLLRVLATSDLTHLHSLLDAATRHEIAAVCESLIGHDIEAGCVVPEPLIEESKVLIRDMGV